MNVPHQKKSAEQLLAELERLPENMVGEVIDGELWTMGRPSGPHQNAQTELSFDLRRGGGGPSNRWLILNEVELLFPSREVVVPDLTGWRRERIAGHEDDNPYTIRPDWVCEVLSPSTRLKDLGPKRQLYARQFIPHLWVIDPQSRSLEAFELQQARWSLLGMWSQREIVSGIAPFPEFTFDLSRWWLEPA